MLVRVIVVIVCCAHSSMARAEAAPVGALRLFTGFPDMLGVGASLWTIPNVELEVAATSSLASVSAYARIGPRFILRDVTDSQGGTHFVALSILAGPRYLLVGPPPYEGLTASGVVAVEWMPFALCGKSGTLQIAAGAIRLLGDLNGNAAWLPDLRVGFSFLL